MYIDTTIAKKNDKSYVRHLLRSSFRVNGKVTKKTIANLSNCTDEEINAIKLALKHKKNLKDLSSIENIEIILGKRIGAVWTLHVLAEKLGISKALGTDRNGKLALLQVIVRLIDQGSRLSAVRFAMSHAVCEVLGIDKLDEDDLYKNLSWLAEQQEDIEKKLFKLRYPGEIPTLFLYDVTSSYLEGTCNALADWGYNRDKKRGKKQIVIGLLTDSEGLPVAVRVFKGNTNDTKTVGEQIRILAKSFGVSTMTLVGDRGMLKGPQIKMLPNDFRYITAIGKPQIRKMLGEGTFQLDLFENQICEVEADHIRYILRRNPVRAEQVAKTREEKHLSVNKKAEERMRYLAVHPKADVNKALAEVQTKINKLNAHKWLSAKVENKTIVVNKDEDALKNEALLDGCYVIKSDVPKEAAEAQTLHDRYCDLENVERSFRTMKTCHLEMHPVFVQKKSNTKGHAFVVMLALLLQRKLEKYWVDLNITVEEGLDELAAIHMQEVHFENVCIQEIPTPNKIGKQLLKKAHIILPSILPSKKANVSTKKKLPSERKNSSYR